MADADEVLDAVWSEWSIRVLVLLSFALQVTLLILAEFRRRVDSGIVRFFVWSAYMLADGTAIYVLGHMSITASRMPQHELKAFWAPFLLVHLGGQDNITAYAIEDNRLWLRHLQTLVVQVAIVSYIIHLCSIVHSPALLLWATILMFVVGVTKYGERVWALRCAGNSPMEKNYRKFESRSTTFFIRYYIDTLIDNGPWDAEAYLLKAHRMLKVPKEYFMGTDKRQRIHNDIRGNNMCDKDVYMVVKMQLSLMYDVFYTKVEMIHSNLCGLCIHILLAVATTIAFLLFHILVTMNGDHKDKGYNRLDVAVTYVLSVGAVVLETASAFRSMFSSWTCDLLVSSVRRSGILWTRLGSILTSLRRLVHAAEWRSKCWSGSMGQHNLLELGARSRASSMSRISRRMEFEDWWNTLAYSWSIPVSPLIEELLVKQVMGGGDLLFDSKGRAELMRWGLYDGDGCNVLTWCIEDRILVWHIATSIYLRWWYKMKNTKQPMAEAIEALSNYMMFLLAARPYMLSPTASRKGYVELCYGLITHGPSYSSAEELANKLQRYGDGLLGLLTDQSAESFDLYGDHNDEIDFTLQIHLKLVLQTGCKLGAKLIRDAGAAADTQEVIAQVWVEALCYAARQCSVDAHAKQLGSGSEIITVAAILVENKARFF